MFRITFLAVVLGLIAVIAGCDTQNAAAPGTKKAGNSNVTVVKPLTADQKVRWKKFQKNNLDGCYCAGFRLSGKEWHFAHDNGWLKRVPTTFDGWSTPYPDIDSFAKSIAAGSEVKATVIIDLASNADPRIICWYCDKGDGPVQSTTPPTQELAASLRTFLYEVQTFKWADGTED